MRLHKQANMYHKLVPNPLRQATEVIFLLFTLLNQDASKDICKHCEHTSATSN